jgi:type III secretion protein J
VSRPVFPIRRARAACCIAAVLLLAACKTPLNSNLSEREANDEVALLLRNGIPASREADAKSGASTVSVEQGRFADAVDLLRAHGLPPEHHDRITDIFKGGGLVTSPVEERARLIYALGEQLSQTISGIDGVLTARVQIVMAENDPLRRDLPPASASVFVRYSLGSRVTDLVPQIKMLVADGVSGLSYDKVAVVLVPATPRATEAQVSPSMANVGGFWVYDGQARALQTLLAAVSGLVLVLISLVLWLGWKARRLLWHRSGTGLVAR